MTFVGGVFRTVAEDRANGLVDEARCRALDARLAFDRAKQDGASRKSAALDGYIEALQADLAIALKYRDGGSQ